nr:FHA domain-containing protein [Polyangiaceae bacterium]
MASYRILIQGPGFAPQTREVSSQRTVIGREAGDIVVPDPRCSSTHAELLFDGQSVRVRDLGSSNGTWVQGQRVQDLMLQPGTTFQIGQYGLTLQDVRRDVQARGQTMLDQAVPFQQAPGQQGAGRHAPGQHAPQAPSYGANAPNYGSNPNPPNYGSNPNAPHYGSNPNAPQHGGANPYAPTSLAHAPAPQLQPHYAAPGYGPSQAKKGFRWYWAAIPLSLLGACGIGFGACAYGAGKAVSEGSSATAGGAPLLTAPKETTVQFVWFSGEPGPTAKGGTAKARIKIGPNPTKTVSVGVSEEFAGGGGNQWKTATWLAAFNATRATHSTLADYEFNVHVGGFTDGPSAGMLTTATMLALLKGATLREDTTMTGTVNPDGSAGPVGGIVQKMEGAKATGLKRFGFPIGCRNHKDMKTGRDVDLVSFGESIGLETKEINDLNEAYEFMTGQKLERVEGVSDSELEPSSATTELLRAKTIAWKAKIDRAIGDLKQESKRSGNAIQLAAGILASADETFEKAKRYEKNGFLGPALNAYAETAIQVSLANRTVKAAVHMSRMNIDSLLEELEAAQKTRTEVDAFGSQLEIKGQSKTRGAQIQATAAFTTYVNAKAATMIADDFSAQAISLLKAIQAGKIAINRESVNELMDRINLPTVFYDVARVYLDYSKDLQDLIADEGTALPMDAPTVDRTVGGYASASTAVLEYFDALIVEAIAKEKGVTKDEVQMRVARKEPEYY